jgi:hypothetical protein
VEFKTNSGTIDINPIHLVMVLDEVRDIKRNSCVLFLSNGMKQVVSEDRETVIKKIQRLCS